MVSKLASGPSSPILDTQESPKNSEEIINNVAKVNQWHWLEESGLWLENFDQTHLELGSGKPVPLRSPGSVAQSPKVSAKLIMKSMTVNSP